MCSVLMCIWVRKINGVRWISRTPDPKSETIWTYYKELINNAQVFHHDVLFVCQKAPRTIKYILKDPLLTSVMEDMYKFKMYQTHILKDILILLERFLRIHYNVMLGTYPVETQWRVLVDIQKTVDKLFEEMVFNVPEVSTVHNIMDIDAYISQREAVVKAVLLRYLRVVANKYMESIGHLVAFDCY